MLLLTLARAASVSALVEVGPDGPVLRDAVLLSEDAPSSPGALLVFGAEGELLASADLDASLHRSILFEEGGGAAVELQSGAVRVRVPWPQGAATLSLGGQTLKPRVVPPAEPMQASGPSEERLDLVILGDGYQADELDLFAADADRMVAYLLSVEPYGSYSALFNVWRIDQASADSGVSHDETGLERDTAYDCFYGCGGIDRLVCCSDSKVLGAVNDQVPQADGVLVLINDPVYGGAGGFSYATSYTDGRTGEQVAAHEVGHSLVGLWDEYSYGYSTDRGDGPNCAIGDAHWEQWLEESEVGAFEVCSYTNYLRPTDDGCMMRNLRDDYCPVCREQAVLAIYDKLPSLLLSWEPQEDEVTLPGSFSVQALGPDEGGLDLIWSIDGEEVTRGAQVDLACQRGEELTVTVHDPTPWVRLDERGLLTDERSWTLSPCALDSADTGEPVPRPRPECGCAQALDAPSMGLLTALLLALTRFRV